MSGTLARHPSPADDAPDPQQRPRRHLNVLPSSRQNSIPQGYNPHPEYGGEEEIIVEAGIWVVFNRRILSWIKRKQYRNGE